MFGYFAGVYYWFPKWTGRMLSESVGKLNFWMMLVGFNLTFAPMHILGLNGMPRRTYRYDAGLGWDFWNLIATIGAFLIAASVVVFIYNLVKSKRSGAPAGNDPWDGRTLEWSISSPPPVHNFDEVPVVRRLDDFWYTKYGEDEQGRLVALATSEESEPADADDAEASEIHMPSPSYYPALASVGLVVSGFGLTYLGVGGWVVVGVGLVISMWGLFGWSLEPVTREDD